MRPDRSAHSVSKIARAMLRLRRRSATSAKTVSGRIGADIERIAELPLRDEAFGQRDAVGPHVEPRRDHAAQPDLAVDTVLGMDQDRPARARHAEWSGA